MSDLPRHDADKIGSHNHYNFPPAEAARLAQELKDNPLLTAILAELDTAAVKTWRQSLQLEQREMQWHQMAAIQRLVRAIESRIETVRLAPNGHLSRGSVPT